MGTCPLSNVEQTTVIVAQLEAQGRARRLQAPPDAHGERWCLLLLGLKLQDSGRPGRVDRPASEVLPPARGVKQQVYRVQAPA